MERLKNGNL